ncbi:MAG: SNF2 helicase associated domain-containing protein [Saprospiraceae bacterium]|nr:SNF2 helicase associated domain-containing protein [Saprospiraceae bacterium]
MRIYTTFASLMEEFQLIYGLQPFNGGVVYFYPEPYIARVKKGKPAYMEKIGTAEVISSYGITVNGTIHEKALALCKEIHPSNLVEKYRGKHTKVTSVVQLFEDAKIKMVLSRKVEDVLSAFLVLSEKHKLPFYFHIQRKVYLEDIRLAFSPLPLKPLLRFEKTATGTNYFLYLCLDDRRIVPSEYPIELIGDLPARIIHEGFVYLVEDVNGAKLRPFLKQEKIFIPERITFEYFNKFIKDVVGTTQIEVEGYDFEEKSPVPVPLIRFGESFHTGAPEVLLSFVYENARFVYGDKSRHKVIIRADEGNAIGVTIYRRQEETEVGFVKALHNLDMGETAALRFAVADTDDDYTTLQRVLQNIKVLKDKGFTIELPRIEGRQVSGAEVITGRFEHELKTDWFDLNLYIYVGDQQISFASLLTHIRNKQRLFTLSNGEVFIIPLEWMEKYETLARMAVVEVNGVKLAKARHSVLDDLTAHSAESKLEETDFEVPNTIQALLRPYQIEGARWLAHHHANGLGACLADDMGLGKTLQTLTLLCYVKAGLKTEAIDKATQLSLFDAMPVQRTALQALIVVPYSLVFNWLAEIRKFAPSLIALNHTGLTDRRILKF